MMHRRSTPCLTARPISHTAYGVHGAGMVYLGIWVGFPPKETRTRGRDQGFESVFLQQRVSCEPEAGSVMVGNFAFGPVAAGRTLNFRAAVVLASIGPQMSRMGL